MNLFKKFKEVREKQKAREEGIKNNRKLYDEWLSQDANPEKTQRSLRDVGWIPFRGGNEFMYLTKEHLNDEDELDLLETVYKDFLNKEFETEQGIKDQADTRIEILRLRKKIKKHCTSAPRHIVRPDTYFSDLYKIYIQYSSNSYAL